MIHKRSTQMEINIESRRENGARMDQIRKQRELIRVFWRGGPVFRRSMAENDAFTQRNQAFAQRLERSARRPSLSEEGSSGHASRSNGPGDFLPLFNFFNYLLLLENAINLV